MEELWLDGHRIDLPSKTVSQTLQINDLAELKDRQANYTNRFKVPMTPKNVITFECLGITGNKSQKPYEKLTAKLVVDGIELISKGYAQIKETNKNYEIVIYDGNISLYESLKGKKINELKLHDLNHFLNLETYRNSFNNTEGYIYGIGDFGVSELIGSINIERQAPSLYVHTIWDRIFKEAGATYSGDLFQNEDFLTEVITITRGYSLKNSIEKETTLGVVQTNTISKNRHSLNILNYNDNHSLNGLTSLNKISLITNVGDSYIQVNYSGRIKIKINTYYSLISGYANVVVSLNGSDIMWINLTEGVGLGVERVLNLSVNPDDELRFYLVSNSGSLNPNDENVSYDLNVTSYCTVTFSEVTGGQYIDFNKKNEELLPSITQIEFLKDVMQRYGLVYRNKRNTNHYEFKTIEAILNDRDNAEEWSDKFSHSIKEVYKIGNYAKVNTLKFKYEKDLLEATNDSAIIAHNDNIEDEKNLFTSIYKISIKSNLKENQPIYKIPIWERIQKENNYFIENKETDLRLFRINKVDSNIEAHFFLDSNTISISGEIPYLSLNRIDMEFYKNKYYKAFSRILKAAKKHTEIFYLSPIDIYNVDFFKLKFIKQLGQYFYLNKVSNFVSGKLTKCELIRVNGFSLNQPPSQLGVNNITISYKTSISLELTHFTDTNPEYKDPEFDEPELIKITSFASSDVVIKYNGSVINSETIIDVNDINSLIIEDLGNVIPEHNAEFDFKIKSFNNDNFSNVTGKIKVKVLERVNVAPNADAGIDRTLSYDSSTDGIGDITLNGCNSSDINGDSLTYQWTIINPPNVVSMFDDNSCQATITVNDPRGLYHNTTFDVKLRVTDSLGLFDEDIITIILIDFGLHGGAELPN